MPSAATNSAASKPVPTQAETGITGGAVAGIVLGTAAIIVLGVGLWILWRRTNILRANKRDLGQEKHTAKSSGDDKRPGPQELEVIEQRQELGDGRAFSIHHLPEWT